VPNQKVILLTGSTGFVGSALLTELKKLPDFRVVSAVRSAVASVSDDVMAVGDINGTTDYSAVLTGVDFVIHAAARAHIMRDEVPDPLVEYRKVNVEGTLNLARQAASAGVKRFIYISSIKVNGESTTGLPAFTEADAAAPDDTYGVSKQEAEDGLRLLGQKVGMEVVIIRPPLVYGSGVKANFLSLMRLSAIGLPLPFGSVSNYRSMVYVENLVDFIIRCIGHPLAANQTFLVSDGEDVSLRQLITEIRLAMGKSPALLPVPVALLRLLGKLTGKSGVVDRLVGDLQIDSSKARNMLDWIPPYTFRQGIAETVKNFNERDR
jgi:nucleoside-diphosphate-sugar epimerase